MPKQGCGNQALSTTTKAALVTAILIAAFFSTYYGTIDLYPVDLVRVYSLPQGDFVSNSSSAAGAWEQQMLFVAPAPGLEDVARDMALVISEPRPVKVENITFTPFVEIAKIVTENQTPLGAKISVYSTGLFEPNTTYNMSAFVAEELSWFVFTTGSQPHQLQYEAQPSAERVQMYSLDAAAVATLAAAVCITIIATIFWRVKRKHSQGLP